MTENDIPLPFSERIQDLLFDPARRWRKDVIPALMKASAEIGATDAKNQGR